MTFDKDYINQLRRRLRDIKKLTEKPLPEEIAAQFDYRAMLQVSNSVWIATQDKRPFTPLIKQISPGETVPINAPFTRGEREYIKDLARTLHLSYGEPVFEYTGH